MSFVAAFGKLNVDLLYSGMPRIPNEGEEIYCKDFKVCLGGGFPATMINCSRLGVTAKIGTFLGDDMFSQFAKEQLSATGTEYVAFESNGYPLNVTSAIITSTDRTFVSYGNKENYSDEMLEKIYNALKGAKIVGMQERILPVYKELKKDGAILVLDTGYSEDMSFEKIKDMIELADYYTPNIDETEKITGTRDYKEALKFLHEYFEKPVVKLGRDGCSGFDGDYFIVPEIKEFKCVDATGAGDAFLSGFMYGLYNDLDFRQCILAGNITGGKCVTGIGCLTEYVNEKELEVYLKEYQRLIR
ncbi:MAG: carbohydrate kinase family protein [Clostridia bacterium]|nr:carbohydrate kinase family protein [Clostridia bacterium]